MLVGSKALYLPFVPFIIIYTVTEGSHRHLGITRLATELHELCHVHQEWYTFKEQIDYSYLKNSGVEEMVWIKAYGFTLQ